MATEKELEEDYMESQSDFENKPIPPNTSILDNSLKLSEVERLKFQNIQLQKKILVMQQQDLNKQEISLVNDIKMRTGNDITGWNVNMDTGECIPRNGNG